MTTKEKQYDDFTKYNCYVLNPDNPDEYYDVTDYRLTPFVHIVYQVSTGIKMRNLKIIREWQ